MPNQTYNRLDNLKEQIRTEQTGGATTSLTSQTSGVSGASYSTASARWLEDGVVVAAFVWGRSTFDSLDRFI